MDDFLLVGDRSGRPDVSHIDQAEARELGRQMYLLMAFAQFDKAKELHRKLNQDVALYSLAFDHFKELAKTTGKGAVRASECWQSMVNHDLG